MSIAIATKGRLWPIAEIIREQFTCLEVVIVDPIEIELTVEDIVEISSSVACDDISTTLEIVDTVTGVVIEADISGNTEGCY